MARVDRRPRRRLPIAQRRSAILAAAQQAFAQSPYDQVSLAGIADVAGASEALVHRYFATKGDLYVEIVGHAIEDLAERLRSADASIGGDSADQWQRVAVSIDAYLDFVALSDEGWAAPLRSPDPGFTAALALRTTFRASAVEWLRDTLDLGDDPSKAQTLYGYLGFLDAACLAWSADGCPEQHRSGIMTMALGGLSGALAALDAQDD